MYYVRILLIILFVGIVTGTVVGMNAAGEISAYGGETTQHILQVGTIGRYIGWSAGIFFVVGLIIDFIIGLIVFARNRLLMRRYRQLIKDDTATSG